MRTASNGRAPNQCLSGNQQTTRNIKPPFRVGIIIIDFWHFTAINAADRRGVNWSFWRIRDWAEIQTVLIKICRC